MSERMADRSSAPEQTFVEFEDADFNQIKEIKETHGVTWREMLIAGAIRLTRTTPLSDPPDLPPDIPLKPYDCAEADTLDIDGIEGEEECS